MTNIGKDIKIGVTEYNGKKYVDIRKYYKDESGEEKPTKKGITMSPENWNELVNKIDDIKTDIEGER